MHLGTISDYRLDTGQSTLLVTINNASKKLNDEVMKKIDFNQSLNNDRFSSLNSRV